MAVGTDTTTKTQTSLLGRAGLIGLILAGVALAVPVLYTLYAQFTGNVSLSTADQITNLFKFGIILSGVALVLSVIALALNGSGLLRAPRRGMITTPISAVLLVVTAIFLFAMVLPRANAIQHLNDKVVPFALSMRDNCKTPLNAVTADLAKARDDATLHLTDDAGFAAAMQTDAAALTADQNKLSASLTPLQATSVPDAKYQSLKDGCVASVKGEIDFLSNSNGANAIPLPSPFDAIQAKVSAIQLITLSAAVASGSGPVKVPSGTIEPFVSAALQTIITLAGASETARELNAEGDALTQDIAATLTNNLAPFKSTVPVQ